MPQAGEIGSSLIRVLFIFLLVRSTVRLALMPLVEVSVAEGLLKR